MEEENLLKERLQVITDKRRIRDDIRHKRRDIEEEKLKLQYIKKKSLREQWLMEGLQSEEEQETRKVQVEDELQRTTQLQSNIQRMEKEIEDLEAEELNISANEETILKRLKEVERTTEDIIKELNAEPLSEESWSCPLAEDSLSDIFMDPAPPQTSAPDLGLQEPKRATFAMEISVELDKRTGKAQVISTATVTPDFIQGKGQKVYEDGRKSVYTLTPSGRTTEELSELTRTDVDELLRQATDWSGDVQYHQAVYAVPFTGSSRPSTSTSLRSVRIETPEMSHCGEETKDPFTLHNNLLITNDFSDSPYAILGSVKTSLESAKSPSQQSCTNVDTGLPDATHTYETNTRANSITHSLLNVHSLAKGRSGKSTTLTPALSCSGSEMEEFQDDVILDEFQTHNPQRNNDFCKLASAQILSPMSPILFPMTTHRYELDLMERSISRSSPRENEDSFHQSETPSPTIQYKSKTVPTISSSRDKQHMEPSFSSQKATLVSVRAASDRMPTPTQPLYTNIESTSPSPPGLDQRNVDKNLPTCMKSPELAPGAVTMIFMGYENVDDDEEDSIQAEVVMIEDNEEDLNKEEDLSTIYHPNGYTSRVFQPVVGVAKVTEGKGNDELRWRESEPHKPSFRHKGSLKDSAQKNLQGVNGGLHDQTGAIHQL